MALEAIQQVHQQQFLVLMFVLYAQLHQGRNPFRRILQQRLQPRIHPMAPGHDIGDRRAAEQTALRPGMACADGFVIGVELIAPERVAGLMFSCMGLQHEGVEEPGGVA